ncbi:MAG: MipA/OmpV family protein [Gammaproteobacteria bacterium]|nr:MipA/OmpV family protein [Gammaproteobacteria bacterium]MDP2139988.1 MipA/OmpV family protein [Gammaproteobacteria bacterium]MDP2347808.1 MipA/OmpV family protein [Gammaproteobacteria bacterium]
MLKMKVVLLLVAGGTVCASISAAEDAGELPMKPLWELGVGAGVRHGPDYPASSERHLRGLALPVVIYRGDVFRIGDGQAARAVAFENERIELDLSFDAAFDAESEKNERRSGMPDLDYMFQVGPQLKIHLQDFTYADNSRARLILALQARGVFSTDLRDVDQHGYVFEPMIRYRHYGWLSPNLDATLSIRPLWASKQLHEYFFDVAPAFVTIDRPLYESESGYFGTGVNLYGNYRVSEKLSMFLGVQTTFHQGAANEESPLFEKKFTTGVTAGFVWSLRTSSRMVSAPD